MTRPLETKIRELDRYWPAIVAAIHRAETNLNEIQPRPTEAMRLIINQQRPDPAVVHHEVITTAITKLAPLMRAVAHIVANYDYPVGGEYNPNGPRHTLEQWANQYAPPGCNNCAEHDIYRVRASRLNDRGDLVDDGNYCTFCREFHKATTFYPTRLMLEAKDNGRLLKPVLDAELAKLRQAAKATRATTGKRNRKRSERATTKGAA